MSHKVFSGVEFEGSEIVVPTAGFRSLKNARNARTNKKNRKFTTIKRFPANKRGQAQATEHAKKLSAASDAVRRINSSMGRNK